MMAINNAAGAGDKSFQNKGNGHDGFSCKGVQIGLFLDVKDGDVTKHVQTCMIPIEAEHGGIAAVTIPTAMLDSIVPSKEGLKCCAGILHAIAHPQSYVHPAITDPNEPQYRGGAAPCPSSIPDIQIDVKCVANADGSLVVIPRISDVLNGKDPQEMIVTGEFGAYKDAAWDAFQKALNEAGVYLPAFFECEDDKDSDGNWVVSPISICSFMDLLFPCLIKDCDTAFLFNPVENGVAKKTGLFPITLEFSEKPKFIWMPSLIHNDPDIAATYKQKNSYYVYTNKSFNIVINDHLDPSLESKLRVRMSEMSEFLPHDEEELDGDNEVEYRSLLVSTTDDEEDEYKPYVNYVQWRAACRIFQHKRLKELQEATGIVDLYDEEGVYLRLANLIGDDVPKHAVMGKLVFSDWVQVPTSDHTARTRKLMQAEKEEERASKRQADAEQNVAGAKKYKQ